MSDIFTSVGENYARAATNDYFYYQLMCWLFLKLIDCLAYNIFTNGEKCPSPFLTARFVRPTV